MVGIAGIARVVFVAGLGLVLGALVLVEVELVGRVGALVGRRISGHVVLAGQLGVEVFGELLLELVELLGQPGLGARGGRILAGLLRPCRLLLAVVIGVGGQAAPCLAAGPGGRRRALGGDLVVVAGKLVVGQLPVLGHIVLFRLVVLFGQVVVLRQVVVAPVVAHRGPPPPAASIPGRVWTKSTIALR